MLNKCKKLRQFYELNFPHVKIPCKLENLIFNFKETKIVTSPLENKSTLIVYVLLNLLLVDRCVEVCTCSCYHGQTQKIKDGYSDISLTIIFYELVICICHIKIVM